MGGLKKTMAKLKKEVLSFYTLGPHKIAQIKLKKQKK